PATSAPVTANCSSGSTRSPRPGAPRPSPPSATSSPPPAPALPAPASSSATRSNPAQVLHKRSPYVGSPGARYFIYFTSFLLCSPVLTTELGHKKDRYQITGSG